MSQLKGKVAVVTGGNSGIGYSTAKEFKKQGATVIITGKNSKKVQSAAQELGVKGIVANVLDISATESLVEKVNSEFGNIDVLFVNAGVFKATPIGQTTSELYDLIMDVNVKGAFFTIEKFYPILNEGASIINLSSMNAYIGMPTTTVYAASKAALNAYTRTAAMELAPKKIRVNSVNPGPISTPILEKIGMPEEQLNGFTETVQSNIPL